MRRLPVLPPRSRPSASRPRAAAAALFAVGLLLLSLSACKDDDDDVGPMTPAGAALVASAPAVATANVPPPPVIVSASTAPAAPASTAAGGELATVEAQLDTTLNKASACTANTECRSVAVGGKACGGPTDYRAYSSKSVSPARVEALAQRERELATQASRASHEVSTCFMLADPGAHCEQHKCVTGPSGP